jgi:hypothetical protein
MQREGRCQQAGAAGQHGLRALEQREHVAPDSSSPVSRVGVVSFGIALASSWGELGGFMGIP